MVPIVGSALVLIFIFVSIHGWFAGKARKPIEDEFNRRLRNELESARQANETSLALKNDRLDQRRAELEKFQKYLEDMRHAFSTGIAGGRRWLAHYIAEADRAGDEASARWLRTRNRPAIKASELLAAAQAEKRAFKEKAKFLEYQLESYKEYFPFLEEYEEIILDESVPLLADGENLEALESSDPVLRWIPGHEFATLTPAERNQRALDRYLQSHLSHAAIGRFYERSLGYQYENSGWEVEYHGIVQGYEDLGRDLICKKDGCIHIVQAKCWAAERLIHEKHIFQLYGTVQLYLMKATQDGLLPPSVKPVFVTSTSLSPVAKRAAEWLKIQVRENHPIDRTYPLIKCNINQTTHERIYHLPFDQQYDRTKIVIALGERYVRTVAEAEGMGFRRAFHHVNF